MEKNQKGFAAFLAKKDIVFSAKRYGIDVIITRDKTGFAQSALPVCHPSEWQ